MTKHQYLNLPQLDFKIWILALGRLLSQLGSGFTLFYAPIFFVNQVGLSATVVGIAVGSGSVSGILGRFLGGVFTDSPTWGRRKTLLLSAAVSAIADGVLALTTNFPTLVLGNLLMGLGVGLYWPATEAAVADLTTPQQRNEAFAITRLADNVGLSLGVVLGGAWIAASGSYQALFLIDGVSFLVFFGIIFFIISETSQIQKHSQNISQGWWVALHDRRLMVYVLVNILFTTYLSQIQTTLPLYFKNFVAQGEFSAKIISGLFSWHIVITALTQLPIARFLNRLTRIRALMVSLVCWGVGFILVWITGIDSHPALIWAILALSVLGIATVAYTPSASALVVELAPPSFWGVYLSINSQCWAIGYLIGPPLGGWALDQPKTIIDSFWLICAASVFIGISILRYLETLLAR